MSPSTNEAAAGKPLPERVRPRTLDDVFGQAHLTGPDGPLRLALDGAGLHSMILWGPPGTGKTTLARVLADANDAHLIGLSAVMAGVKDVRAAVEAAKRNREQFGSPTLLFLDEVHRFNKAQQDAFLPHVEDGTLVFLGATTENPSFALNNALLSRARVYVLNALDADAISAVLTRALTHPDAGLSLRPGQITAEQITSLAQAADGDARRALNLLEQLATVVDDKSAVSDEQLKRVLGDTLRRFDRGGDAFYDLISALHKSVRGSNPDAAAYYVARMLDGGCDPRYVVRRLIRIASEDIGNADPRGLTVALDAGRAFDRLGSPEGELAIYQAAIFLACMAKSDAVYRASKAALGDVKRHGSLDVPKSLRNAPTSLMRDLGHGEGYRHAHGEEGAYAAGATYFPEPMGAPRYYEPVPRGLETRIGERLEELRRLDDEARGDAKNGKIS